MNFDPNTHNRLIYENMVEEYKNLCNGKFPIIMPKRIRLNCDEIDAFNVKYLKLFEESKIICYFMVIACISSMIYIHIRYTRERKENDFKMAQ